MSDTLELMRCATVIWSCRPVRRSEVGIVASDTNAELEPNGPSNDDVCVGEDTGRGSS
jgi:hypothetical protein